MQLLHEDVTRAHVAHRLDSAARQRRAARLVAVVRAQRRADESALRARHLVALAVGR